MKNLVKTVTAMTLGTLVMVSAASAACYDNVHTNVTYSANMAPEAIAVDRSNRANVTVCPRQANDTYVAGEYLGRDPDLKVRGFLAMPQWKNS